MQEHIRHCDAVVRESCFRQHSRRRCSYTPSPVHSARTHHQAFALRTFPATRAAFSFGLSCRAGSIAAGHFRPKSNPTEGNVPKQKKTPGSRSLLLKGKPISASRSEMAEVVLPATTNLLG